MRRGLSIRMWRKIRIWLPQQGALNIWKAEGGAWKRLLRTGKSKSKGGGVGSGVKEQIKKDRETKGLRVR